MRKIISITRLLLIGINPAVAVIDYVSGSYIICTFLAFVTGLLLSQAIIQEIEHD